MFEYVPPAGKVSEPLKMAGDVRFINRTDEGDGERSDEWIGDACESIEWFDREL